MTERPHLILDCYYDEKGSAPNFRALLGGAPSTTVRVVYEPLPTDLDQFGAIFLTGSKANLPAPEPWMHPLLELIRRVRAEERSMLGICFGHQAIAAALGGLEAVRPAPRSELGWETIRVDRANPLMEGLAEEFTCFVSHFDEVSPSLQGVEVFASSECCPVQGFQVLERPIWSMQFHPEMDPDESEMLVRSNLARHASLGNDPEEVLATRRDSRDLGAVIFRNFLRLHAERGGPRE